MADAKHIASDGQLLPASGVELARARRGRKPATVCWLLQVCQRCGIEKPYLHYRVSRGVLGKSCKACRVRKRRPYKSLSLEQKAKAIAATTAWKRLNKVWLKPGERDRRLAKKVEWRRRKAATQGRVYRTRAEMPCKPKESPRAPLRKLHALRLAMPDACLAAWYWTIGKPWNNPRITPAEKFRLRYRLDDAFRARQVLKAQGRKVRRAERIQAQSDGTVTPQTLGALFAAATHCHYCRAPFESSTGKTADHVMPLMRGGLHSLGNLVIACFTCNTAKGRKTPEEWLASRRPPTCHG